MKIGIITLSASYNCGSMLQSYALKEILIEYGDVEIINFSSEASHILYDIVPTSFLKKIKMKILRPDMLSRLEREVEEYKFFQKEYLGITGKEYWARDLVSISNKYDIVVVGSDQVWNVCMRDFDEAFFCSWTKSRKIAYAPSLGGHDIRESVESERIISAIKDFSYLSCRETLGKSCLEDILQCEIKKVLDPTLLIEGAEWKKIAGDALIDKDYIFYYSWAYNNEELSKIVKERSKKTDMPVYVIDAHKWVDKSPKKNGFILYKEAGPLAFLKMMANAKECFVESFHGMLFAYMLRRNFWLLDTHADYDDMDTRLKELVELVNGKDRIVTKYNYKQINFSKDVMYVNNAMLARMQQYSIEYLKEAFGIK